MKFYMLTNLIWDVVKYYAGKKELMADTQFSTHTIAEMVEDGIPRHGYILDEVEREDYEIEGKVEEVKCKNIYAVPDELLNSVPCYTVYDCKHCSKRS